MSDLEKLGGLKAAEKLSKFTEKYGHPIAPETTVAMLNALIARVKELEREIKIRADSMAIWINGDPYEEIPSEPETWLKVIDKVYEIAQKLRNEQVSLEEMNRAHEKAIEEFGFVARKHHTKLQSARELAEYFAKWLVDIRQHFRNLGMATAETEVAILQARAREFLEKVK